MPGIFACGNVLHVHDLVDHVSNESFRAGHAAAAFVRGAKKAEGFLRVEDGFGVRGTVPQRIGTHPAEPVTLMFRPSAVFRNASAVVSCGGRELLRKKAMIFTPGEMAAYELKPELLADLDGTEPIVVQMEEGRK